MWMSQTYDVIDYYSPFMLLFEALCDDVHLCNCCVTPGFRRQTECEPCTCQDQQFMYTAIT
jgi:hypothetical protein